MSSSWVVPFAVYSNQECQFYLGMWHYEQFTGGAPRRIFKSRMSILFFLLLYFVSCFSLSPPLSLSFGHIPQHNMDNFSDNVTHTFIIEQDHLKSVTEASGFLQLYYSFVRRTKVVLTMSGKRRKLSHVLCFLEVLTLG